MIDAASEAIWERCAEAPGPPGMIRGPALCDQPTARAEPDGVGSRDGGGAGDRPTGNGVLEAGVPCCPVYSSGADVRRPASALGASGRVGDGFRMPAAANYGALPRACDEPDHDHVDERQPGPERRGVAHQDRGRPQED
jgi:hypothetical protein